jgi:hypothetical protein
MGACYSHLSYRERLAIMDGRRNGLGVRAIARGLGRAQRSRVRQARECNNRPYDDHGLETDGTEHPLDDVGFSVGCIRLAGKIHKIPFRSGNLGHRFRQGCCRTTGPWSAVNPLA